MLINGTSAGNTLTGTADADEINGLGGNDIIDGGAGDDRIDGGSSDDRLTGGAGNDIFAYGSVRAFGDDTITDFSMGDRIDVSALNIGDFATLQRFISQSGQNTVIRLEHGGADETITLTGVLPGAITASSFIFNTSAAALSVTGTTSSDVLFGGNGNDTIDGRNGPDTISGGAGADIIDGGSSDDLLIGGAGNDIFSYGSVRAFGNDTILDFQAGDRIDVSALNIGDFATLQRFISQSGSNTVIRLEHGGADETITLTGVLPAAVTADSFLFNTSTNGLVVTGTTSTDVLFGGNGNDTIEGRNGSDTISGGAGADVIDGGSGDDLLIGGSGNDIFAYGSVRAFGNDTILDFSAGDRIDVSALNIADFAALQRFITQAGSDTIIRLDHGGADETIRLSSVLPQGLTAASFLFNTSINGVTVTGTSSTDVLFGGNGNDTISGGNNADVITGGAGSDTLSGGSGNDLFVFQRANQGADQITDFVITQDRFDLSGNVFTSIATVGPNSVATYAAGTIQLNGVIGITLEALNARVDNVTGVPPFYLLVPSGGSALVQGTGSVFGANGSTQEIVVRDFAGRVSFDGSFNTGGDRIVLSGPASNYTVTRSGATVTIADSDTSIVVPVGLGGADIVFGDGVRSLSLDTSVGAIRLGTQAIGATPVQITAGAQTPSATGTTDPNLSAFLLVSGNSSATAIGRQGVFGTAVGAEVITVSTGAQLTFDGSFNAGGDIIGLPGAATAWTASRLGATVTLTSGATSLSLPAGTGATTLRFADGDRALAIDLSAGAVRIGTQTITGTPTSLGQTAAADAFGDDSIAFVAGGDLMWMDSSGGDGLVTIG